MPKTTLLTLSLPFLLVLPAMAQLGNVWTDFQAYSVDLQNYLTTHLRDTLLPLEPQARTAISNATGDLNIPNPILAGDNVRAAVLLDSTADKFENNSAVRGSLVSDEIDRLITWGAVAGVMGPGGQIRYKTKLEHAEITLENIARFSEEADRVNADFLNQLQGILGTLPPTATPTALLNRNQANLQLQTIKIQSEQAKILAENLAQAMQGNQFLQYSNLNLANISQQVEQTNRARRVDTSAEAARLLRTSSQIDLFGRKY